MFESEESQVWHTLQSTDKLNIEKNMKWLVNGKSNWPCYDIYRYWFVMMESIAQTCDALRLYRLLANRMALLFVCGEIGWMYLKKHIHESTFVSIIHSFWMVEYWQLKLCMHRVTWLQTSLGYHKRKSNIWISFIILFVLWSHLSILFGLQVKSVVVPW